jgi:hypothetical protein
MLEELLGSDIGQVVGLGIVPRPTSTLCLVEQANQPDLFGRHGPCQAKPAPAKTQVEAATAASPPELDRSLVHVQGLRNDLDGHLVHRDQGVVDVDEVFGQRDGDLV